MKKNIFSVVSEILSRHEAWPNLLKKIENNTISPDERTEVCLILTDELIFAGFKEDYEPNSYWLEIEEAIDEINRPNLHSDI